MPGIEVVRQAAADAVYYITLNLIGFYVRYVGEINMRRGFLDKRGCIETTFKLKYEKEQEVLQTVERQVDQDENLKRAEVGRILKATHPKNKSQNLPTSCDSDHKLQPIFPKFNTSTLVCLAVQMSNTSCFCLADGSFF